MTPLDLRPLTIGEMLDRAFTLYRRHWTLFVGIMAVFALRYAVSVPALVIERVAPRDAIRRSVQLTKRYAGRARPAGDDGRARRPV